MPERAAPVPGILLEDGLAWMQSCAPGSIGAVVTDPPFALKEFEPAERSRRVAGTGGVWRRPPALDGCRRRPVPRFTVLTPADREALIAFYQDMAAGFARVLVPGGHAFVATSPLFSHLAAAALEGAGLEKRGEIVRLVQTLRGGDRPKGAEAEFRDVTVMPRSAWEPWLLFRRPFGGTVAACLRRHRAGALRREGATRPFTDVIPSAPTPKAERALAPHDALKPQDFMRRIVRAALPLGEGIVLDPFMGGGSTIAAAVALGYQAIGIDRDPAAFAIAREGIPRLAALRGRGP